MTATVAISRKGQRLVDEDRVAATGKPGIYKVKGDHDEYVVWVADADTMAGYCPCKAHGACSHLFAACLYVLANPEAVTQPTEMTEAEIDTLFDLL